MPVFKFYRLVLFNKENFWIFLRGGGQIVYLKGLSSPKPPQFRLWQAMRAEVSFANFVPKIYQLVLLYLILDFLFSFVSIYCVAVAQPRRGGCLHFTWHQFLFLFCKIMSVYTPTLLIKISRQTMLLLGKISLGLNPRLRAESGYATAVQYIYIFIYNIYTIYLPVYYFIFRIVFRIKEDAFHIWFLFLLYKKIAFHIWRLLVFSPILKILTKI